MAHTSVGDSHIQGTHGTSGEKGQVLTLVALFMTCLLVMLGLAIDLGFLYYHRRQAQTAADAAARSAVMHLYPTSRNVNTASEAALYYALLNGFDNNGADNTVTVNIPPTSGPYNGNADYVEVLTRRSFTTIFLTIISRESAEAAGRAVSGVRNTPSDIAFLSLSSSACPAVRLSSDAQLTVTNGRFVVNGSCSEALRVSNSAVLTAPSIEVVGGYRKDSGATISPTPQTGAAAVADPLASLAAPPLSGVTVRNGTPSSPSTLDISSGIVTLNPGVYYGGMRIRSSARVTLNAGTYILAGGGLSVSNTAVVSGDGVFFYNTKDPSSPSGDGAFAQIVFDVDSPGNVTLIPPTSGDYSGIVIFQDRANTQRFQMRGSLSALSGTVYLPTAVVEARVSGGTHTAQIIAQEFEMSSGGSRLTVNFDGSTAYQTVRAYLTE